ncbi:MAG: hypothetical protein P8J33_17635 [Pirellulaceae bacterium]|nr:hypothetical protein [Pirellulaceae bacterium]
MTTNRANWTHPDLQSLTQLFFEDVNQLGQFTEIPVEQVPTPYRELLGHTYHMTVTVENYHNSPVNVEVLEKSTTENHYARKILLRRQSDNQVVQFGIVRLTRSAFSGEVWRKIESEQVPLGRVLIEHDVMRNVKLMSTWKIKPGPELAQTFSNKFDVCYGRTALIYTNSIPAVELLEIVVDDS